MPDDDTLPEPKKPWFDPLCALLMAVASLATAWCSYQNSRWSGETGDLEAYADKREREAVAMHLESLQTEGIYLRLLMEVVDDKIDGREKQAEFYLERFPPDLRAAWDKWMALKPFDKGSSALAHPLLHDLYEHPQENEIRKAKSEAHAAEDRAHITGVTASTYLSNTVLLATVLFFAGTAGKFDHRRVRWSSLAFALALFVYAGVQMLMLPVR